MDDARRWWPNYLFHCTELHNAVNVLSDGALLSRTQAKAGNRLAVDIASQEIIDQTNPHWTDFVRLYFRPRTPTQYRNEGIRPSDAVRLDAHCALPVYFLFDSVALLGRPDAQFAEGNVAANAGPSSDEDEFERMPFEIIYHEGRFEPNERGKFVYHRNAEVLVPNRLGLDNLTWVVCRSQAEYETLLHLLPLSTRRHWAPRIGVRPDLRLFHNSWTFVERVDAYPERLVFAFNRDTKSPGPFVAHAEITRMGTGARQVWRNEEFQATSLLHLRVPGYAKPWLYEVRLHLDGHLAYANRIRNVSRPF